MTETAPEPATPDAAASEPVTFPDPTVPLSEAERTLPPDANPVTFPDPTVPLSEEDRIALATDDTGDGDAAAGEEVDDDDLDDTDG